MNEPLMGKCSVCGIELSMHNLFLDQELGEVCFKHLPKRARIKHKVKKAVKAPFYRIIKLRGVNLLRALLALTIIILVSALIIIYWDYLRLLITTDIKAVAENPKAFINKAWRIRGVAGDYEGGSAVIDDSDYCIRTTNCFTDETGDYSLVGEVLVDDEGVYFNCTADKLLLGSATRLTFEDEFCYIPPGGFNCSNSELINFLNDCKPGVNVSMNNRLITASFSDSCGFTRQVNFKAYTLTSRGYERAFCEESVNKLRHEFNCAINADYYGGVGVMMTYELVCGVKIPEAFTFAIN